MEQISVTEYRAQFNAVRPHPLGPTEVRVIPQEPSCLRAIFCYRQQQLPRKLHMPQFNQATVTSVLQWLKQQQLLSNKLWPSQTNGTQTVRRQQNLRMICMCFNLHTSSVSNTQRIQTLSLVLCVLVIVQVLPRISFVEKNIWNVKLTTLHLVSRLRMKGGLPPLPRVSLQHAQELYLSYLFCVMTHFPPSHYPSLNELRLHEMTNIEA